MATVQQPGLPGHPTWYEYLHLDELGLPNFAALAAAPDILVDPILIYTYGAVKINLGLCAFGA